MPVITKCVGDNCPIKENCYRFVAKAEPLYQSYFVDVPGKWISRDENDTMIFECEMFWGENSQQIMNQLRKIMEETIGR